MRNPDIIMSTYVHNTRRQQPDEENLLVPGTNDDEDDNDMEGLPYEDKVSWACLIIAAVMLFLLFQARSFEIQRERRTVYPPSSLDHALNPVSGLQAAQYPLHITFLQAQWYLIRRLVPLPAR